MGKKTIQEQFGAHATDYVTSLPHARGASLERLIQLIPTQPHWKILDIATGAGHTAFAFAPVVAHVWATDITEQMLAIVLDQAQTRGLKNVTVEYADAEELQFEDGFFDLVTCRIAPHHFLEVGLFMQQSARVLRSGGIFALVDNIVPDGPVGDYINAFEKLRDPSHGRCLSLDEWLDGISGAGFSVEHQETIKKKIIFNDWAARHDPLMRRYLSAVLTLAPPQVSSFLQPQMINERLTFRLQEVIIIGRRT